MSQKSKITFGIFEEKRLENDLSSAMKEAGRILKEGGSIEEMRNAGRNLSNAGRALDDWDKKHGHSHQNLQGESSRLSMNLSGMISGKEHAEEQRLETAFSSAMKEARRLAKEGGSIEEMQKAGKALTNAGAALNDWDRKHGAGPEDNYHGHEDLKNGFSELSLNLGSMISRQQSQKPSLPGAPGAGEQEAPGFEFADAWQSSGELAFDFAQPEAAGQETER